MSRAEKHGRLLLFAVVAFAFVVLLLGTDRLLGARARKADFVFPPGAPRLERSVRLREWPPSGTLDVTPPDDYLACTEGLDKRPYRLRVDADGYIEPSRVNTDPDRTILFLGGSTTECLFMDEEARLPRAAGRVIEQRTGKKINALNAGHSGNHTLHALAVLLGKGLAAHPDVAVLHENINDLNILLYYGTYWNQNPTRSLLLGRVRADAPVPPRRAALALFQSIVPNVSDALLGGQSESGDEFADMRGKALSYDREAMIASFRAAEQAFVDTCRAFGVRPVLLTQASRITEEPAPVVLCDRKQLFDMGLDYATFRALHRAFNDVVRDVGRKNGVLVVDLEAQIPQEARFMYDTVHYTAEGSLRAAGLVGDALAQELAKGDALAQELDKAP